MNNQEKQKWECKSRLLGNKECPHKCIVTAPFEPMGCLLTPVYEKWEKLIDRRMME